MGRIGYLAEVAAVMVVVVVAAVAWGDSLESIDSCWLWLWMWL